MIEPKPKKCKGTHPTTKGFGCGKESYYRTYGLCRDKGCYQEWLMNTEAGKIKMKKATIKATKPRRDFEKFEKEEKERKSLPNEIKITQRVFNMYIRLRDEHKPCISQNTPWKPDHDAGHLFSVKQYSELRFDEDNCHGQSIGANRFEEGDFENYIINVKYRIGQERLDALVKKAENSKKHVHKWTIEELKEIRKKYSKKIKELKIERGL